MFVEAVWVHLVAFGVGQAAAWAYARSGRFWVGATSTALLWGAADWWLVSRFLLDVGPSRLWGPLLLLHGVAVATAVPYVWARLRRRRGRSTRATRHRAALALLLSGAQTQAESAYRELVWTDAWDPSAWIGLGDVQRRRGDLRSAARSYRRALAVDVRRDLVDLIEHRQAALGIDRSAPNAMASDLPSVAPKEYASERKSRSKRSVG